jgi:hypothetical protein
VWIHAADARWKKVYIRVNERVAFDCMALARYRCSQQANTNEAACRELTDSRVPTDVLVHKSRGNKSEETVDQAIHAHALAFLCTDDPLSAEWYPSQRAVVSSSLWLTPALSHTTHISALSIHCVPASQAMFVHMHQSNIVDDKLLPFK